jgi:hypothetical protein
MQLYKTLLFPGQQADERIHLVTRQHWMVFAAKFAVWLMFVAILLFTDWAVGRYLPVVKSDYGSLLKLAESVYFMLLILGLLIIWIMYYLNILVVTNERIVDITQTSLLSHTVSELHLSRIEDVTAEVKGLLPTFLNYGNLYVQTAGETERFVFDRVPDPARLNKLILDLYEALPAEAREHKDSLKK